MRALSSVFFCLASSLAVAANAQDHNRLERENWPYLVLGDTQHPGTGQWYAWPPTQPPKYSVPGQGVPAGTHTFKVFDPCVSKYTQPTPVSGFTYMARNSAATLGPNRSSYIYAWDLRTLVPRSGGGYDPDMSTSLVSVPSMSGGGASLTYRVTTTFQPVSLKLAGFAMSLKWRGGEQRDKDANAGQGPSQNIGSTYKDGPMPYVPDGFVDPQGNITYNTDPRHHKWITLLVERMVVAAHSDWGSRGTQVNPPPRGHSLGTYFSKLARQAGLIAGSAGWDVIGGRSRAGHFAFPLFNLGAKPRGSVVFLGWIVEVDLTDPSLGFLLDPYFGQLAQLDAAGIYRSLRLPLPSLPTLLGQFITVQFLGLDVNTMLPSGQTGAASILIGN